MHLTENCQRNSKIALKFLVGQAILKLWINFKTVKLLFGSITQEPLGLPKFWCYFRVPWTMLVSVSVYFLCNNDIKDNI